MNESELCRQAMNDLLLLSHAERFSSVLILLESLIDPDEPGEPFDYEMRKEVKQLQRELLYASRQRPEMSTPYFEWMVETEAELRAEWIHCEQVLAKSLSNPSARDTNET